MNYLDFKEYNQYAILTIKRPPVNALCHELVEELYDLIRKLEDTRHIRAMVITGAGEKAFMAGADINELDKRDFIEARHVTKRRQEVFNMIENLHFPVIAAVNGYALGGGLELALSCTIRMASEKASFAAPEINLGITPGDGATQRLPRVIGQARAMMMILTGTRIDAETALTYGLITSISSQASLFDDAVEMCKKIASKAPLAVSYAKQAVLISGSVDMHSGLMFESYVHALSCASTDKEEGVEAFLNKRQPDFLNK
ncbi:hypothetical protein EZV73_15580 [Acidaminobacter sp. JC074]|uniref:enoyl-CoA hydratase/isomerase family protein n=1 Tax=Acidaminobacter sp. JC074 TaxID=2530199 RepID=UPI001F10E24F|nr:enoyl-CoA hydratase-related protein [Acidaminobacter sp. JC074]MCH4889015.1 hypothetical protein [Acidaminobacter sp. JC074]